MIRYNLVQASSCVSWLSLVETWAPNRGSPSKFKERHSAGVVELVDTPDLGSDEFRCQ